MFLMGIEKEEHLIANPHDEFVVQDKWLWDDNQLYGMIEKTLTKLVKHVLSVRYMS